MTQLPVFAEFVQSPEYHAWKERPKPDVKKMATKPETRRNEREEPATSP